MSQPEMSWRFPKPGRAVLVLMIALGALWILLALGINWAGLGEQLQAALVGDTDAVWQGQLWRLVTAALIHSPKAWSHVAIALMLLYFFASPLEERWGSERVVLFLFGSSAFAYSLEVLVGTLLPALQPVSQWYGSLGMAEAAAVAWAISAPSGQVVRLFFLIPVRPMMMVGLIFVVSVLSVIAQDSNPEGLISPFGGMLAGYLFSDSSPLRRLYLKLKLKRIQAEVAALQRQRQRRGASHLRLIQGGSKDDDDEGPLLN